MAAIDVTIEPAELRHADEVGPLLRQEEIDEVFASGGMGPTEAVRESIAASAEAWLVRFNGAPACVFGVSHYGKGRESILVGRTGIAWLLSTSLIEKHPRAFWIASKKLLRSLLERWDRLVNHIDARHTKALRWAKRLGFKLEDERPFGCAGLPFVRFSVTREDLYV